MSPSLLDYRPVREYLGRSFLCSVPEAERRIALTFDDGPNPRNTPRLLDLLARRRVRATFFVLGRYVRRYPDIVRRAVHDGHEIANHGHHHLPLPFLPTALLRREIRAAEDLIAEVAGRAPEFFRPPMGWFSGRVLRELQDLGYQPVLGNVHPGDSRRPGAGTIVSRVLDRVEPGSIVILHDGGWTPRVDRSQTIEAVGRLLDVLGGEGYRFTTVGGLLASMGGGAAGDPGGEEEERE